jgi:hypothetical protein
MANRRYSEKQVALILQRAAEISTTREGASGTSLEDLERIALEAGLDPGAVRQAALEVERGGAASSTTSGWARFLGGPTRITKEARIEGELSPRAQELLIDVLQRHLPTGQPSLVGRTLTWQSLSMQGGRQVTVAVSSRDGATTVRIDEPLANLIGGIYGGVGGGFGGSVTPLAAIGAGALFGAAAMAPT